MNVLFGLSPWLQLPLVMLVAVPAAGVAAVAIVRAVDWFAQKLSRK